MLSVGILVFDGVGILDFSGPYEVFSTAGRVHDHSGSTRRLFRCFLIAAEMRAVRARGGIKILPDCVLLPPAEIDVLIIPGGDVLKVVDEPAMINWIQAQARDAMATAGIGSGASLLVRAGLLDKPDAAPWTGCGKVVACAAATGIDMSLRLVERLAGRQLAHATAQQMEYRWNAHDTNEPAQSADSGLFSAA